MIIGEEPTGKVGASLTLRTCDKMGNYCTSGGADVKLHILTLGKKKEPVAVDTRVVDLKDGSYELSWRSKFSGTFRTRVAIGDEDVIGSPMEFSLSSSNPDLSKSDLTGDGLKAAVAGVEASIRIKFVDQYWNVALPDMAVFTFGMAFVKHEKDTGKAEEQRRLANAEEHAFAGAWDEGDKGVYEMKYMATEAGVCKLHVWCDPLAKGERLSFPGSPFALHVSPGEASTDVSQVDGWAKQMKEEKNAKYGKGDLRADANTLIAGDTLNIRPEIFDE